jgi:hypothetical protein
VRRETAPKEMPWQHAAVMHGDSSGFCDWSCMLVAQLIKPRWLHGQPETSFNQAGLHADPLLHT